MMSGARNRKCLIDLRAIASVALLSLLSACSSMQQDDEKEETVAPLPALPAQAVELEKRWSRSAGSQGEPELALALTPALEGGSLYTANADGDVRAISRVDGDVRWTVDLDVPLVSAVGAGDDLVVVCSVDGGVHALDAATGAQRWRAQASSEVLSAAAVSSDVVVVQAVDSRVQAFDAATGQPRWNYSASQAVLGLRGNSAPVLRDDAVFVAFDNGKFAALSADNGVLRWEQRFIVPAGRSELERVIDVQADPLVTDDAVVVGSYQGAVVSATRERGQPQWEEKASVARGMAEHDGSLFLVEGDGSVRALRLSSGREAWKAPLFAGRRLSSAAVIGDYVAVADSEGYVHLLAQADGSYAGRYSVGGDGVRADLRSDGETLYVLTNTGRLYALSIEQ